MKQIIGFIMIVFLCNCSDKEKERVFPIGDYWEITQSLSVQDFESIKSFILENGDRQTYCNMLLDNPHYSFEGFEVYLNPEIGQKNIRCDPEISDFNMLVIRDQHSDPQYYHILIVRQGDLKNEDINSILRGMKEEKVYLIKYDEFDNLDSMVNNIDIYLDTIKNCL